MKPTVELVPACHAGAWRARGMREITRDQRSDDPINAEEPSAQDLAILMSTVDVSDDHTVLANAIRRLEREYPCPRTGCPAVWPIRVARWTSYL
jgi:hypothetical protein